MFSWLRSFVRRGQRSLVLDPAVEAVMETMERRRMLSSSCSSDATSVTFNGDSNANSIVVSTTGGAIKVADGNISCSTTETGALITINGNDGNDTITVD